MFNKLAKWFLPFLLLMCFVSQAIAKPTVWKRNLFNQEEEAKVWNRTKSIYLKIPIISSPGFECYRPDLYKLEPPQITMVDAPYLFAGNNFVILGLYLPDINTLYYPIGKTDTLSHELSHYIIDEMKFSHYCLNEISSYILEELYINTWGKNNE